MGPPDADRSLGIVARLREAGCVFAEEEADLLVSAAASETELSDMVERRVAGAPLEHILGWVEFCGLRICVDPGVFVPRRRTEFLVGEAIALTRPGSVVVDLCCGSGALGRAMAEVVGDLTLYAVDIDETAVACARRNLAERGRALVGDLFDPLPRSLAGRIDVLLANVPYVPSDELRLLPPEARLHEPRSALDGGADGLDVFRRVLAGSPGWLAPGGHLLIETSRAQVAAAARVASAAGLEIRVARCADIGATVLIATMPTRPG